MIWIDGELCYSPEPPEAYTRNDEGHGLWVHGDIRAWNMVWLSFPQLDQYQQDTPLEEIIEMIDPTAFGQVAASASHNLVLVLPGLRDVLGKTPDKFYYFAGEFAWEQVVAYKTLGEDWVTTMRVRAQQAMTLQRKISEEVQNVIKVDFKKGRAA